MNSFNRNSFLDDNTQQISMGSYCLKETIQYKRTLQLQGDVEVIKVAINFDETIQVMIVRAEKQFSLLTLLTKGKTIKQHLNSKLYDMTLLNNSNELILVQGKQIQVWILSQNENEWKLQQVLGIQDFCEFISLFQKGNQFIVIIWNEIKFWRKDEKNKWVPYNVIKNLCILERASINDSQSIFLTSQMIDGDIQKIILYQTVGRKLLRVPILATDKKASIFGDTFIALYSEDEPSMIYQWNKQGKKIIYKQLLLGSEDPGLIAYSNDRQTLFLTFSNDVWILRQQQSNQFILQQKIKFNEFITNSFINKEGEMLKIFGHRDMKCYRINEK